MTQTQVTLCMGGKCIAISKSLVLSKSAAIGDQCLMCNQFAIIRRSGFGTILVDTGYHHRYHFESTEAFPARIYREMIPVRISASENASHQLESLGISPATVKIVIITHFHADHVNALRDFPRAKFLFLKEAYDHFQSVRGSWRGTAHAFLADLLPEDFDSRAIALANPNSETVSPCSIKELPELCISPLKDSMTSFGKCWDLFGDGSVSVISLPGHCAGHVGVYVRAQWKLPAHSPEYFKAYNITHMEKNKDLFLIGDSCWLRQSFELYEPPSWLSFKLVHCNQQQYLDTLYKIHQLHLENKNLLIVPTHCLHSHAIFLEEASV